jgi:V-type H+-transporting ATPase subunit C
VIWLTFFVEPADQYLRSFAWNKVKYRADKPLAELIDSLQKVSEGLYRGAWLLLMPVTRNLSVLTMMSRAKLHSTTRSRRILQPCSGNRRELCGNGGAVQLSTDCYNRGNLSTKSLTPVVDPKLLIQDSEYLETHLVVVPTNLKKDFLKSYETISPMVVPRSSIEVTRDDEFTLFAVTTFKKHSSEFQHKCREMRWTPRDYKYVAGGIEEERKEVEKVSKDERKIWGEALRLGRTGWSESVMIWVHVLTLRVFVETVLRYGLPLDYVCGLVKVCLNLILRTSGVLTSSRQPPNKQRKRKQLSTRRIHTLVGMHLEETRKAKSLRTILHCHQRWQQQE